MNGHILFILFFFMILLAYLVLFMGGKHYLKEYFQSGGAAGAGSPTVGELYPTPPPVMPPLEGGKGAAPTQANEKGKVVMEYVTMDSVAKNAIQNLDDYEYNLVFQNENDRELSTDLRNKLMSQRPMDWAGLPPSSAQFQAGTREAFVDAAAGAPGAAAASVDPYANLSGESMTPPDTLSMEIEERKLLQTYKAPSPVEMVSYRPEDEAAQNPEELIQKIYSQKGLIPTVAHQKGTNVYEITGVRRKDEKIVYEEDEAPAAVAPVQAAGEARISVPAAAYDYAAAKDPFYDTAAPGAASSSRMGKWDYQAWTPGLERMFAPTNPKQDWY